ncbi:CENP-Q, a CENPA-CAD centromere complex subunit-domain-containing protein [Daldinia vernicosa]|uniref:CENP-Q, a CENPA-CAD centromere complex subunit-domain-containing protein n=1 Tax=Daldinia vernicosa TaxID=114800 RepID=UPI00200897DE|nr:CENP-Q, a CENPA-CAD centromere complex subunit-domain-containing protein [Daldinia vernicosa]KAI0853886.1 CENP-Q, a CENPA-CAD centromere complex subunit-domain-containing protein [Daldinia vernicosa]
MAPETANQKRKRGRPTNVSRDDGDASGSQLAISREGQLTTNSGNTRDSEMEESSRPRKRGRPANAEIPSQAQPEPKPSQTQKAKRKRGPSPTLQTDDNGDEGGEDQGKLPTDRKKRGRPRASLTNDETEAQEHNAANTRDENASRSKRGRPTKELEAAKSNEVEDDEADDENEGNSSLLRRSGRIRRSPESSNKGAQEVAKPANEQRLRDQITNKRQKKGRPPTNEQTTAEAEHDPTSLHKKKRGRPSLSIQPPAEADPEPQGRPKKRGRQPPPDENASSSTKRKGKKPQDQPTQGQDGSIEEESRPRKSKPRQSNKTSPKSGRRRPSPDVQDRSSSPDSATSPPRYRHLATRTRRVPLNIIESKWTALEQPALSSVASLLQSASRPVLLRLSNPQRHGHAAAALNAVSKRLCTKIARGLPFPPATTSTRREEEFEFERTVSGIQALESQLDPLLHSVELLRREKERAEKELDREYKALARLGSNAHAEARERRDQMRKMHVLVPEKLPPESRVDSVGEVVSTENSSGKVFADLDDELAGLAGQIANHMESMRGNLQQIDGVVPAITKSQGLLRAALQSRLDREQLDNIILG